ncbi:olfactory receptor 10C1-like [Eublepharis macularius]|uniref:Olfactory receptor n=1 Tax=Eublepharis macularius TaxID=481883 RepID=A0AA97LCD5_EUBMA|nr:olfactory receptor 10C1-like [Eublepharis macularius]
MGPRNFNTSTEFILEGLSHDRKTQILLFVVILFVYIFTLVGNAGIILLVRTDSQLHTPMYFFLTQLSSVEICYVNTTIPQMLAHLLAGHAELSLIRCALQMYTALALSTAEALLLGVMAYDRYLAICHPLVYITAMGRRYQVQLASACWIGGLCGGVICVSLTFSHPFCGPCCIKHFICEMPMVLKLACDDPHITEILIFVFAAIVVFCPVSVILTSYGLILLSLFQMQSVSGLRKAFSTCGSHLAVVTMFYGSATFVYIAPRISAAPGDDKQAAVFYLVVTPLLNPIIYTLRNKDVHAAMAKVLRKWRFQRKDEC